MDDEVFDALARRLGGAAPRRGVLAAAGAALAALLGPAGEAAAVPPCPANRPCDVDTPGTVCYRGRCYFAARFVGARCHHHGPPCRFGSACTATGQRAGKCVCPTGRTRCGRRSSARCRDLGTDRFNCGRCGAQCLLGGPSPQACCAGACCPTACRPDGSCPDAPPSTPPPPTPPPTTTRAPGTTTTRPPTTRPPGTTGAPPCPDGTVRCRGACRRPDGAGCAEAADCCSGRCAGDGATRTCRAEPCVPAGSEEFCADTTACCTGRCETVFLVGDRCVAA